MNKSQKKRIKAILNMSKCRYCLTTENLTLDHKIPLVKGGSDEFKNLQALCLRCNKNKGQLTHGQVRGLWRWFDQINKDRLKIGKKTLPL